MLRKVLVISLGCVLLAAITGTWKLHANRVQLPVAAPRIEASTPVALETANDRGQVLQPAPVINPREARRKATDYRQLINLLMPLATNGSAAAQYEIASALRYCDENWRAHVVSPTSGGMRSPEELRELNAKLAPNTQSLLSDAEQRCRSFAGDLAVLGTSKEWLDQSVKLDYPPALLMQAASTMKTLLLNDGSAAEIQQARQEALVASTSGDPEVIFGMAGLVDVNGKTREQMGQLVSAWWLVACESGYNCGPQSDAVRGVCTVDPQCADQSDLVGDIQRINGANFGEVQQLADQIRSAIGTHDPNEIKKYL